MAKLLLGLAVLAAVAVSLPFHEAGNVELADLGSAAPAPAPAPAAAPAGASSTVAAAPGGLTIPKLEQEIKDRTAANAGLTSLVTKLQEKTDAAAAKDAASIAALETKLKAEVEERQKQDGILQQADKVAAEQMKTLVTKMTSNTGTATSQLNQVSTAVSSEQQSRTDADAAQIKAQKQDQQSEAKQMTQLKNTVNQNQEAASKQMLRKFDELKQSVKTQMETVAQTDKQQDSTLKPTAVSVAKLQNSVKDLTAKVEQVMAAENIKTTSVQAGPAKPAAAATKAAPAGAAAATAGATATAAKPAAAAKAAAPAPAAAATRL